MPRESPGGDDADRETLERLRKATLGEYEILGELGRGGMAIVYLAHDILLDKKVAIKLMNPGLLILMGPEMAERFKREARTAAALEHPNVIPIYLIRETNRLLYFIMKYVEGRGLDSIMADVGPLPIPMALTILGQVGAALGYAHRRGVVHRDVKPANILIDSEGRVVVTDFGIAKVAEAGRLTKTDMTVGTPSYMSPEQCSARPVTGASDQYSLGIVGFEMISGKPPFVGDSLMEIMRMHFFETPPPLTAVRPECPPLLAAAIDRMLAKEPQQRWPSIEDAVGSMGNEPLRRDDPVQSHLIDLARSGPEAPGSRMSTPVSPSPIRRAREPEAKTQGPQREPPAGRPTLRRTLAWGTIAGVAVAAALGIYRAVPNRVAAVEVLPSSASLRVSGATQLTAVVKDARGAPLTGRRIVWSSSDPSIAVVSESGLVTGIAPGHARINASSGPRSDSAGITVAAMKQNSDTAAPATVSLDITPTSWTIRVRGTVKLMAMVHDSSGRPVTGRPIIWSSGTPSVAGVSQGLVTGVAPGIATIEASVEKSTARATIIVRAGAPAVVTISPAGTTVSVGNSVRLAAKARDSSGRVLDGLRFTWSSSDSRIASVSQGVVTGLAPGFARIAATSEEGVSGRAAIMVASPISAVLQVAILPNWANVTIDGKSHGQQNQFQLRVLPEVVHSLRFERPGYVTVDTSVRSLPGDTIIMRIRMIPDVAVGRAVLQMRIEPWASVSIDGTRVGERPYRADTLVAGAHRLHFERDGYVTLDTTVTLQPGETRPLKINMKRRGP